MTEPELHIAPRSRDVRQKLMDLTSYTGEHQLEEGLPIKAAAALDALERFTLWAGNVGAMRSAASKLSLDQRLAGAPEVRGLICQLLDDLQEAVNDLLRIVTGERENHDLTGDIGFDDEGNVFFMASDSKNTIKGPSDEANMILEIISECITSLFRAGVLIRKAGTPDRFTRALQMSSSTLSPVFDISHVREKHPKLNACHASGLAERLGNAIAQRRQFIKYSRDHRDRLAYGEFSDAEGSRPGHTAQLSSKATSFHPADPSKPSLLPTSPEVEEEDLVSVMSASTFSGSISTLKLPRLGDLSTGGQPFECPICFTLQSFRREKAWRIHAFRDLKAYICTVGGKDCKSEYFGDRNSWFEHEIQRHRAQYTCVLCAAGPFAFPSGLETHISDSHGRFSRERLRKLQDASKQAPTHLPAGDCPFCDDWGKNMYAEADAKGKGARLETDSNDILVTATHFKRHVAVHQEQLALFAMPSHMGESGNPESGSAGSLSAVMSLPGEGDDRVIISAESQDLDSERERYEVDDNRDENGKDDPLQAAVYPNDQAGELSQAPTARRIENVPFFSRWWHQASGTATRNSTRLTLIREPGEGPPCMDVVLIHGLAGTSHDTWTWHSSLPWKRFFWPAVINEDRDLQLARVWAYGYNSAVFTKLFEQSATGIPDFAHNLLVQLESATAGENVPIVFVAHCIGGLVAKQAYLDATTLARYRPIANRVCGFLFLGTPHKGSDFAVTLAKLLRFLGHESKPSADDLRPNSRALDELNIRFKDHISSHPLQHLHIFSLYETLQSAILKDLVVQRSSATLDIDGESLIPMQSDHQGLARFPEKSHNGLKSILHCLRMCICQDGPWGPSVSMLPPREKKQHLYDWLGTRRLEGEALPYFLDRSAPGTCNWIESDPFFKCWIDDKAATPYSLWIRGVQGSGKSIMASFIAHLIEHKAPCTFSFNNRDTPQQSLHTLLGSLAFQLAHRSRRFCNHLVALAKNGERLNLYTEWSLWTTVFLHELRQFVEEYKSPIYWIIDGLDLCASPDVLIAGLNYLSNTLIPLKIIILTRWTSMIDIQFRNLECRKEVINLDETLAARNALEGFIISKLGCSESEASGIVSWAQGNFRLASLFIAHALQSPDTSLHTIMETVEPEDSIVDAVISSITESWTADKYRTAKNILQCAAYSKSALTLDQISECLSLIGIADFGGKDIERLCGRFLTIDGQRRVHFQHTPIRSSLRRRRIRDIYLDPEESHEMFLILCLRTFQKLDMASPGSLYKPGSFQDYALAWWTSHLGEITRTTSILPILKDLEDFLTGPGVESWVCLLAEAKILDLAILASAALALFRRKLSGAARRENLDRLLKRWAEELPGIIGRFSGSLLKYPRAISELVHPFCPRNSLLHERGRTNGSDSIAVRGITELQWDDTLARIPVPLHSSRIICSNEYIAVAYSDKIFVFSASTFTKVQTYSHEGRIQTIRFSSCGEMLAVYGNRTLKVSKINMTRHWIFTTSVNIPVVDLTFTSDNRNVLVCAEWGDIWKYPLTEDCREGSVIGSVIGSVRHTDGGIEHGPICSAAFNGTGTLLVTACQNLPISVWTLDLSASEPISRPCQQRTARFLSGKAHNNKVRRLDWIPNSNRIPDFKEDSKSQTEPRESELRDSRIVSVYKDGSTWIWDKDLQEEYPIATSDLGATSVKSSPCGSFLVTSSKASLKVWDTANQNLVYEGKIGEQTKDFIICSRSRSVFRLCQGFIEVWGPNSLAQFSVTRTWSELDVAERQDTRSSSEPSRPSVEVLGVGTRTFVHCSAHWGGSLTVFGPDGQMSQVIQCPYHRVVRTITWSHNEETLAVADDTHQLQIYAVSRRQSLAIEEVCSENLGDLPCQILFNRAGTSIFAAGSQSRALWTYQNGSLQPRCRTETSQRLHWISHDKGDEELLLAFRPNAMSIFRWQDLKCLAVLSLSLSSIPELLYDATEPDQNNLITHSITSSDESELLIQHSVQGSPESLELILVEVSEINAARNSKTELLKATRYPPSLVNLVYVPLGLITTEKCERTGPQKTGSVLAFIDKSGWLCTLDLTGTLYEHSFLPRDWLNLRHLELAKLGKDGTLFIPKQGSVAIISNAFRKVIRESHLLMDEDA